MSNALAVATVTAALYDRLFATAHTAVTSATINVGWPDPTHWTGGKPGINVFLYEVAPNAALRNDDLPTRGSDGHVVQKPQAALDLDYLLSFYGDGTSFEPERLLGAAISTLHARPLLDRDALRHAITTRSGGSTPLLDGSNLDQQPERVRFSPLHLSLEELSKLWTAFPQAAFAPSVVYRASLVLIEADEPVEPAPPVASRGVTGAPFRQPVVDQVVAAGDDPAIVPASILLVRGRQLSGPETRVRIDDLELVPAGASDEQLSLPVPAGLAAGVHVLQVVQQMPLGDPPTPHAAVESNLAAFVLRPVAEHFSTTGAGAAQKVTVDIVEPTVRAGQRAALLLNEQPGGAGASFRFDRPPEPADTNQLEFTVGALPKGDYFLRIQVDGAQSAITLTHTAAGAPMFTPELTIW